MRVDVDRRDAPAAERDLTAHVRFGPVTVGSRRRRCVARCGRGLQRAAGKTDLRCGGHAICLQCGPTVIVAPTGTARTVYGRAGPSHLGVIAQHAGAGI